jgi:hypothetical protein
LNSIDSLDGLDYRTVAIRHSHRATACPEAFEVSGVATAALMIVFYWRLAAPPTIRQRTAWADLRLKASVLPPPSPLSTVQRGPAAEPTADSTAQHFGCSTRNDE